MDEGLLFFDTVDEKVIEVSSNFFSKIISHMPVMRLGSRILSRSADSFLNVRDIHIKISRLHF
ncbi:hypothetical protein RT99_13700 [Flavobacterium sp. MEB061]|nr:hypothetical protein RT99_13700 [Flavobacterium sp. MEB061]